MYCQKACVRMFAVLQDHKQSTHKKPENYPNVYYRKVGKQIDTFPKLGTILIGIK